MFSLKSDSRQRMRPAIGLALCLVFGLSDCCIRPALAQAARIAEDVEKDSKEEDKSSERQNSRRAARGARAERPSDPIPAWVAAALHARGPHHRLPNSPLQHIKIDPFGNGLGTRLLC
jgi:hypothetical protein